DDPRRSRQNVGEELASLADGDAFLPLRASQSVGCLDGEDARGNQLVNSFTEVISECVRLVRVHFFQDPFRCNGRIENILHGYSSRSSRMAGTAISTRPCTRKTRSRMARAR